MRVFPWSSVVLLALLSACAAPSGPPPTEALVPAPVNGWVGTQSPGGNYMSSGPEQPFQTLNSLPPGAATTQ